MSLRLEVVRRSDGPLWPSQCCSSAQCTWCPWMGLGSSPRRLPVRQSAGYVQAHVLSLLLYSEGTFPRGACLHLHSFRTDPSDKNMHLQRPWEEGEAQPAISCTKMRDIILHNDTEVSEQSCHSIDEWQPEQPPPSLLDIVKMTEPYFCLQNLLTDPINLLCLAETATACTTSHRPC